MLRVLDLFAGIGGFSLGLERAGGFQTVAFCEFDPYCRQVLARHWPGVPIFHDVRELDGGQFRGAVDVVCGGFPCQDLSVAGRQAGIDAERSGLWSHLARIIGEVGPCYAVVENVPALLSGDRGRWFGRVLGDLAEVGYDAEWHCIPASHVGAPHRRDRVWVVAYPGRLQRGEDIAPRRMEGAHGIQSKVGGKGASIPRGGGAKVSCEVMGHANGGELERQRRGWQQILGPRCIHGQLEGASHGARGQWATEPDVGRVAHGIPNRVDRLRSLGNAVVPQVVEIIGRAILSR